MVGRLAGKVAVVVGAGSSASAAGPSNGQAVALAFAREGATVVCADAVEASAAATVNLITGNGGRAAAVCCDVSRRTDVEALVLHVEALHGRIDVLHNNVGIEALGGPVDTEEDAWDRVHSVNLKGVFLTCRSVIPLMDRQGGGAIINVSSTASLRWSGVPYLAYHSSKAAVNHVTRMVARQYAEKQIRCNAIVPGYMQTPHVRALYGGLDDEEYASVTRQRDAKCPMGRQGTPDDIAHAAVFLASDEASYITGHLLVVDGGSTL